MKNKEQYVLAHEFIGSQVEVVYSPDASLTGMRGIIVDETLNTFRVKVSINRHDEMRIVPKKGNTFKIIMHGNNNDNNKENNNNNNNDKGVTVIVNGSKLVHRAHDRLKMLLS